jgi:putative ABC transport system substrate-binding protein
MVRSQRRDFLTAAGALVAASLPAEAQTPVKIARIGYLNPSLANASLFEAFRQGLHDLGYVQGRNVLIEFRTGQGKPELLPGLAAELVALKVDVIVTGGGTLAAQAAQHATTTVPTVVVSVGDPVTSGLVASLARPGGNISRVAVLWQPGAVLERTQMDILSAAQVAARTLGMQLQVVEARGRRISTRPFRT